MEDVTFYDWLFLLTFFLHYKKDYGTYFFNERAYLPPLVSEEHPQTLRFSESFL